jgi:hypothetical protein
MSLSVVIAFAGFTAFVLAGAGVRGLSTSNDKAARLCARWSAGLAISALALAALWLSAAVFWPMETAHLQGTSVSTHLLRAPMVAIVGSSALSLIALPIALVTLRAVTRRMSISRLRGALAREEEHAVGKP